MKRLFCLGGVSIAALLCGVLSAWATTYTVCAAGCTYTNSGANVQAAIDAAVATGTGGHTILLQQGITYAGTFVLKKFTCVADDATCYITIKTGVNATGGTLSASLFPAAGIRITPSDSSVLAKLQTNVDSVPTLTTADPPNQPKWWKLQWLEIMGNAAGLNYIVRLGNDSRSVQAVEADIPTHFFFEQVYIHGDPVTGQFRGVGVHANDVTIQNSDLRHVKSQAEGQVVWFNSSTGPYALSNNYIEGGTETVFSGGSSGCCRPSGITVASATSATAFVLSAHTDLHVGQGITVVNAAGDEEYTEIASCTGTTPGALCTSNTVTVTPALSATPGVGKVVEWGVTPANLTMKWNYVTRPITWRNPILGTPTGAVVTVLATGGTLAAGTYAYRVVAYLPTSAGQTARSTASAEVIAITTGTTGSVKIDWAPVTNAATYRVFGRSAGGENTYWTVTAPTHTYTDTGSAGTSLAVPTSTGSTWQVKNTVEFKNMDTALVEFNIVENSWVAGQTGYLFLLTPANTGTGNPSTHVRNITARNNIFRHGAGFMQIVGRDVGTNATQPSGRTIGVSVTNNLVYDVNKTYGGGSRTFIFTTNYNASYPTAGDTLAPKTVTIEHNTLDQVSGNALLYLDQFKNSTAYHVDAFMFRNNLGYKDDYGLTGNNSCAQGNGCWTAYTTGGSVFTKNVIADAACSVYPDSANNFCPTSAALQAGFTNYGLQNFALLASSPYHNAATDGTDIGANIATITAGTTIAASGNNSGVTPDPPPVIITASVPNGTVSTAYAATLSATGCLGSCTWAVFSGTLPAGLSLSSSGILSGVPTVPGGDITFQIQATGSTGSKSTPLEYAITIIDVVSGGITGNRLRRYNYTENGWLERDEDPDATVEPLYVGDVVHRRDVDELKMITATAPALNYKWFFRTPTPVTGTPSSATFLRGDYAWAVPTITGAPAVQTLTMFAGTGAVNTNAAAGGEELVAANRYRMKADTENSTQIAITANFIAACSTAPVAVLRIDYWDGAAWQATGASVACTTGLKEGTFATLAAAARAQNTVFRAFYTDGDGVADPQLTTLQIRLR